MASLPATEQLSIINELVSPFSTSPQRRSSLTDEIAGPGSRSSTALAENVATAGLAASLSSQRLAYSERRGW
ncbi:hypothetical protein DOTSEDRAFT_75260 [Dothistroma septosporum NZE10]|uniref:Uncharacterized protein n=1 Tax=Dothistroma septosporum (strain NZE10 / CBS 128990) TaxID=675120 RepID=M2Y2L3_DOTSN|nr:hypothetical protein DOTSEDRAFT_75260 [Dothistroma septosporum NZE10]